MEFPVIDLFAGPGGLGEGFSSLNNGQLKFKIIASAEKDQYAHETLKLRAYFRRLKSDFPQYLSDYYDFVNGNSDLPWTERTRDIWQDAVSEALLVELGTEEGNARLNAVIEDRLKDFPKDMPAVLIGGPPCQAYSLAGRAKNMNDARYDPLKDTRNFLYREYLKVLQSHSPAVFVMENVKGILSSKINNQFIFHQILQDLSEPTKALFNKKDGHRYVICSLVTDVHFKAGDDPSSIDSRSFIIKSEDYGIPQCRHRVILLGIREDYYRDDIPLLEKTEIRTVGSVINELPRLRSKFSKIDDSAEVWSRLISESIRAIAERLRSKKRKADSELIKNLTKVSKSLPKEVLKTGGLRVPEVEHNFAVSKIELLEGWYKDNNLKVVLNHESRGHILKDIVRYTYAACFAMTNERSPRGHGDYDHVGLAPSHKNWQSGKFVDRFKVQESEKPASTITSHISKDGHYFIHYDPTQARSLTVREAARIQTFPDNYFFQGPRTQQYHQVGNAVPPLLANKIAIVVEHILLNAHMA
ncbi:MULTISPECIES: DNA cytosine methyltransferase [Idiomarina]|uniref:DNA cytosine methyltransferase n=1 Tax=Idiomarina TaxID=135575 RepID=UPI00129C525B|nr:MULTISPECIES: DNA (cytosine-5-)-methyltransferase [Idiomarina]MRJ43164.1 DNA (cytosine-5-)-methyltransferase [Idiomarina sp. FeN1]NCU58679.1 DNA (cytosine-5-)-methyltransferase [Idiomarina sp. FenA--70]NCU61375.1 DNA (cytosine-5-)-methyltransferase [Idiomarina sp. FenBw--71]UUN13502.1 DNA (cytosine-5-)-methyltransferase [Idiomarina loihiensis]